MQNSNKSITGDLTSTCESIYFESKSQQLEYEDKSYPNCKTNIKGGSTVRRSYRFIKGFSLALILLGMMVFCPSVFADTTWVDPGLIVGQHWQSENSPYMIQGDISVASLTIEPGVEVLFTDSYVCEVGGVLTAVGTEQDSIYFKNADIVSDWNGIFFNQSNPGSELAYCVIEGSENSGIRIDDSEPIIRNCMISNNTGANGGGIHVINVSYFKLENCEVINNRVSGSSHKYGGGIYVECDSTYLSKCSIVGNYISVSGNTRVGYGGGVYANGNLILSKCIIADDSVFSYVSENYWDTYSYSMGGGVYVNGNLFLINSTIGDNYLRSNAQAPGPGRGHAYTHGGGIYSIGNIDAKNSIIVDNILSASSDGSVSKRGGGIYIESGLINIENCSVAINPDYGIYNMGDTITIINSILWDNSPNQIYGDANVTYSDVDDGYIGNGNIDQNPLFDSNYQIVDGSLCIDAGNPAPEYNDSCLPPALGTERNDMGAHGGPFNCGWLYEQQAPYISCPISPIDISIYELGEQVCIELIISGEESVTVADATWANDTLCFNAYSSGLYTFTIIAVNDYGEDTCEFTADVTLESLPDGLIGHWPLDGDANDISGNGLHGTIYGAQPASDRFGEAASAYHFDGDDYIGVADSPFFTFGSDPFTVMAWLSMSEYGADGGYYLMGQSDGEGDNKKWMFWLGNNGISIVLGPQHGWISLGSHSFELNRWYHVAIRCDADTFEAFVNGQSIGTATAYNIEDPSADFKIGTAEGGRPNRPFRGDIDDVRIYRRALDTLELKALVLDGSPPQINCPAQTDVVVCERTEACLDLQISNADSVDAGGADWASDTLCFEADTSGLYAFTIIAVNDYGEDTCELEVDVIVGPPIEVSTDYVGFATNEDVLPSDRTLSITSPCDPGILNWEMTVYDTIGWLTVDKTSGTNPDEIALSVETLMDPGIYSAMLLFEDPNAPNSPVSVSVGLYVEPGVDIGNAVAQPGTEFQVPITLYTDETLQGGTIPLTYTSTQKNRIPLDSVIFDPVYVDSAIIIDDTTGVIYLRPIMPPPEPDSVHKVGYLAFTALGDADNEIFHIVPDTSEELKFEFIDETGTPFTPAFNDGTVIIGTLEEKEIIIGSVTCPQDQVIEIPIIAKGIENVAGIEFHIGYDTTILQITGDRVTSKYISPTLNVQEGVMNIAWTNYSAPINVPDDDTLMVLWFEGIGDVGQIDTLRWVGLNEFSDTTGEPIESFYFTNGSVEITVSSYDLVGHVVYYDMEKNVYDVSVEIDGPADSYDTTNNAGRYSYSDLSNGNYIVMPRSCLDSSGFSISDAVKVQRYLAGAEDFSYYQMIAADANSDCMISIADIVKMIRHLVKIEPLACGNWTFIDSSFQINSGNWCNPSESIDVDFSGASIDGVNFIGIRNGDVNCSWPDTIPEYAKLAVPAMVRLQPDANGSTDSILAVTLVISDFDQLAGMEVHLDYDARQLEFADVTSEAINGVLSNENGNRIHMAWADINKPVDASVDTRFVNIMFKPRVDNIEAAEIYIYAGELADIHGRAMKIGGSNCYVSTSGNSALPTEYELRQNYPNPFNPRTTIEFSLPSVGRYCLSIYNVLGHLVREYEGQGGPGVIQVTWDGKSSSGTEVASGIYFYRLTAADYVNCRKMMLIK